MATTKNGAMTLSFKRNPPAYPVEPRGYSFKKKQSSTVHVIPTLDELLEDEALVGFYSLSEFTQYLQIIHCVENVMFVIAINQYIASPLLSKWRVVYREFFTEYLENEINLPLHCKKMVSDSDQPNTDVLLRFKRIIYDDILLDLYNEFIKAQKQKLQKQNPNSLFKRPNHQGFTTAPALLVTELLDCHLGCDTDHECFSPKLTPLLRGLLIGLFVETFRMKKFRIRRSSNDKDLPGVMES